METSPDNPEVEAASSSTRKLFSRVLVIVMFSWIAGFGIMALYQSLQPQADVKTVISPFKAWDGEWKGEISITDSAGEVLERRTQHRSYRHVLSDNDFRQEGHFVNLGAKGEAEPESEMNSMDFKYRVIKRKSIRKNGTQTMDFVGKNENERFVWTHNSPGISSTINEWIEGGRGEEETIHIEGEEKLGQPPDQRIRSIRGEFRRDTAVGEKTGPSNAVDATTPISDNTSAKSNDAQTTHSKVNP